MEREFVALGDGCRLGYRFDGPAGAPALLLSNSLGTDMGMWAPQMDDFAREYRVLRYDSRGHGASSSPAGAYSMDRLGRDVVELLDALSIDKIDFCGLSKGGIVGQWLGVRAGDRLRRLVLANTAAYMGPPSTWQSRIQTVIEQGMTPLVEASIDRWFTPDFVAAAPRAVQQVREMLLANDPQGYAGCCAAIRDMDQRPTAHLIQAPLLVIAGSGDPSTSPAQAEFIATAARDGRVATLSAAHLSNVEQPGAFTREVLEFLTR